MLENLNSIDWQSLGTFYGPATNIPEWLRQLGASDNRETQAELLDQILSEIIHQGEVHEVTLRVMPFLVELLESENVKVKADILGLFYDVVDTWMLSQKRWIVTSSPKENLPATGTDWHQETYQLAWQGIPLYLRFIKDPDPKIRLTAVSTLGLIVEDAEQTIPAFLGRLSDEENDAVKAAIIWYLGDLLRKTSSPVGALAAYKAQYLRAAEIIAQSRPKSVLSLASSISLSKIMGPQAPVMVEAELIYALTHPDFYSPLPWNRSVMTETPDILCRLGLVRGLPLLSKSLNGVRAETQSHIVVWALLSLTIAGESRSLEDSFPPPSYSRSKTKTEMIYPFNPIISRLTHLTPEQNIAVEAIVNHDGFWKIQSNLLSIFGLPNSRDELRAMLS